MKKTTIGHYGSAINTPAEAAQMFARSYFAEPRQVAKLKRVAFGPLAATFYLVGGSALYDVWWDQRQQQYCIQRNDSEEN